MKVMTIGLDLAKNVFQVHGVNERGVAVLRKQLKRDQLVPFFARLEPCLIGIEACGGAHFWAAKLAALGHQVKMMAAQFVKPYVKTKKNDSLDAEAICEAVTRPNMRFVPIKSAEQPSVLSLHTAREAFLRKTGRSIGWPSSATRIRLTEIWSRNSACVELCVDRVDACQRVHSRTLVLQSARSFLVDRGRAVAWGLLCIVRGMRGIRRVRSALRYCMRCVARAPVGACARSSVLCLANVARNARVSSDVSRGI